MAKLKVLIRLADNAQLPWNKHLAKQTDEFREKFITTGGNSGPSADQRRIADLEAQIATMTADKAEADKAEGTEPDATELDTPAIDPDQPDVPTEDENPKDDADPDGTVEGKTFGDWTKDDLLQHALEKYNVDLPNRHRKADIFVAIQKLEV